MTITIKARNVRTYVRMTAAVLLSVAATSQAMDAAASDRMTWSTLTEAGDSTRIAEADLINLCDDGDGCSVRLGLVDYDLTETIALQSFLFSYNSTTRHWRTDGAIHKRGRNGNDNAESIMTRWECHFTDAQYRVGGSNGDFIDDVDFGVVKLGNKYPSAKCQMPTDNNRLVCH